MRKLTKIRTGNGGSEWGCLDGSTCIGEPASLCRELVELEDVVDGNSLEELEGDDDAQVLEEAGANWKTL